MKERILFALILGLTAATAFGAEDLILKEGLLLRVPRQLQRSALAVDPVEMTIAAGTWRAPNAGDGVAFSAAETGKWDKLAADPAGWFSTGGDGYLYAAVNRFSTASAPFTPT
jgi:hypothetical protein